MCGVTGFWQRGGLAGKGAAQLATDMATRIANRGPDDSGVWTDDAAGIALAHRRLSIVDLSAAGHQPMFSPSGRFVIVYNGEIYNHLDLRRALESTNWRGHSDTESLLAGFEAWGIAATLKRAVGMFAFALWDRAERVLTLARDRAGEKPLYYGWQGNAFLFGSELKALMAHPAFRAEIDRDVLTLFLRHNYVPSPYSIYKGIAKLPPGTLVQLPLGDGQVAPGTLPRPAPYWSLAEAVAKGAANPFSGTEEEAISALEVRIRDAVGLQMVADVPLGAFLSGGVDSSTVVALMQAQSNRPVKTFTIGFHEDGYNEAEHAKAVARHLGTDHTELYVTSEEARAVIPRLPALYDEPFSDSSQIPTFLVSQMARRHVTVSLSGDAGDELFGGYNRYPLASAIWRKLILVPGFMRRLCSSGLTSLSVERWDQLLGAVSGWLPDRARFARPGDRAHKLAELLAMQGPEEMYLRLISHWDKPAQLVVGGTEPASALMRREDWPATDYYHWMMFMDALTYLPDDILTKVDRAAMGVSLETRVPFLDHRVMEFCWRLPLSMKIRADEGKWILRQVLYKYVPKALIERPKMGFGVPLDSWLRGPLKEWAEALLDEARLRREGYFRPAQIRQKWREHLSGARNWQYYLWDVLVFQSWLEAAAASRHR